MIVTIVHEFGHAFISIKNKKRISEIGFGLPLFNFGFSKEFDDFKFLGINVNHFRISIHPLFILFGTYLKTDDRIVDARARAEIHWGGPFANLLLAFLCCCAAMAFNPHFSLMTIIPIFLLGLMICLPFMLSRRAKIEILILTLYTLISLAALVFFVLFLAIILKTYNQLNQAIIVPPEPQFLPGFLILLTIILVVTGGVEMLPFPPLDGGQIMLVFLERYKISTELSKNICKTGMFIVIAGSFLITLGIIARAII